MDKGSDKKFGEYSSEFDDVFMLKLESLVSCNCLHCVQCIPAPNECPEIIIRA